MLSLIGDSMCKTLPRTVADLNALILGLLRRMDREAAPLSDGYPTGLWWFAGHLDRGGVGRKVQNSEVCWTQRVVQLLNADGIEAWGEQRYPDGSRCRCDAVVQFGFAKPVWLEVKGAWRAKFDPPGPNKSYYKHLQAAAADLSKLERLQPEHASAVTFALVGFDTDDLPMTDDDVDPIRIQTAKSGWAEHSAMWRAEGSLDFRVRVWIWARRTAAKGDSTRRAYDNIA
jgi:hypothetical protein